MRHRRILFILLLPLTLTVWHVCAEYIGPQRSTLRRVRDPQNDTWTCTLSGYPPCHLHHANNPCPDCGGSHPSVEQQQYWCGWVAESCGCSPAWREEGTSLPPATVHGSFTCANPGSNGWCLGGAGIDLHAYEPLEGQRITSIEGDPGALCDPDDAADVSCSWGGGMEGALRVEFWAHSSYGDTSEKGGVDWRLDTVPPVPTLAVSGGAANGGWYRTSPGSGLGPLLVTASGSDASSGFAAGSLRLEGGGWAQSVTLSADGIYLFELEAVDTAGNTGSGSGVVRLDSTSPSLAAVFNGAGGEHGWYRSGGAAAASASDSLSGISEVSHRVDGGGWVTGMEAGVAGEGVHTVEWRARDAAGNQAAITQELRIDSTSPTAVILSPQPAEGQWLGGLVHVSGACSDALSGLVRCQVTIDGGGSWQTVSLADGAWSLDVDTNRSGKSELRIGVLAEDRAGNITQVDGMAIRIDNSRPAVDIPDRWHFSQTVPILVEDRGSGLLRAELWINCGTYGRRRYTWKDGFPDEFTWDRRVGDVIAPPGEYTVLFEAWDRMRNHSQDTGIVIVPLPPTPTPTVSPALTTMPTEKLAVQPLVPEVSPVPAIIIPTGGQGREYVSVSKQEEEAVGPDVSEIVLLSLLSITGLWAGLSMAYGTDRRFTALWAISRELTSIQKTQISFHKDGGRHVW